jgi:uroporphyrinogen decarboxylase
MKKETPYTPIWLMRQAGRYLPEYRAVREKYTFLEMCRIPEVAAEITLQPLRRFELDAAILFSDILITLPPMGIELDFVETKGPVIENPVRNENDIRSLRVPDAFEELKFVGDAIKIIKEKLAGKRALIGFAGAPFTLASYAVEGGHSKNYVLIKKLMWNQPYLYRELVDKITDTVIGYLKMQIESGVDAIQLFDSWIGALTPADFQEFALPYIKKIFSSLKDYNVPLIYFGTMTSGFFEFYREIPASAFGVDWRIEIGKAWDVIGRDKAVQGNLDPIVLYAQRNVIEEHAKRILDDVGISTGHVFNLGHGITPGTPIESVQILVDFVHEYSQKIRNERL